MGPQMLSLKPGGQSPGSGRVLRGGADAHWFQQWRVRGNPGRVEVFAAVPETTVAGKAVKAVCRQLSKVLSRRGRGDGRCRSKGGAREPSLGRGGPGPQLLPLGGHVCLDTCESGDLVTCH